MREMRCAIMPAAYLNNLLDLPCTERCGVGTVRARFGYGLQGTTVGTVRPRNGYT